MADRILVVEDHEAVARAIGDLLEHDGYEVVFCNNGSDAFAVYQETVPDLVVLDLMLPGRDGVDICRDIREVNSKIPIVMLTARIDSQYHVEGMDAGADDYFVKPPNPELFLAHIRRRLAKTDATAVKTLRIGDVVIDVNGHTVRRGKEEVSLTTLEFKLLQTLASRPWQVFTREMLMEEVWGHKNPIDDRLVNVHIQRLRSKVEINSEQPEVVVTVRGIGYKAGSS